MSAPPSRGQRGGTPNSGGRLTAQSTARGRGSSRGIPSTATGGRGRGRGSPAATSSPDGLLQKLRSGTFKRGSGNGATTGERGRGAPVRGSTGSSLRGRGRHLSQVFNTSKSAVPSSTSSHLSYRDFMNEMTDKFQMLKQRRDVERADAIRDGFLADPDKKTSLDKAITPVGTCTEMCPGFERVERIVQNMVDKAEKVHNPETGRDTPSEAHMVKRFRRSAAGYDEQLPSDIRTPATLKKTLDYLLDKVVGGDERLASIHKFVWDRTRGIRNDFSIQQVRKQDDVKIAVECYERIARFHILSLHQLANPDNLLEGEHFDAHQEREQLNNTLLSLMYYYDDNRHLIQFPNEAEFRAYCIIFELQSQHPDLEDRMQSWPSSLLNDQRVQTAFQLYSSAGNTLFDQGPLRPLTPFSIAQGNAGSFWKVLSSKAVPYLMACVAEIYFGHVRFATLDALWRSCKSAPAAQQAKSRDWTLGEITNFMGFDTDEQTVDFCAAFHLSFQTGEHGEQYLDLTASNFNSLDKSSIPNQQVFSHTYVEAKRYRRTLVAVINGYNVARAIREGLIEADDEQEKDREDAREDDQSMFIPEDKAPPASNLRTSLNPQAPAFTSKFGETIASKPGEKTVFGGPGTALSSRSPAPTMSPGDFSEFRFGSKPSTNLIPQSSTGFKFGESFNPTAIATKAPFGGLNFGQDRATAAPYPSPSFTGTTQQPIPSSSTTTAPAGIAASTQVTPVGAAATAQTTAASALAPAFFTSRPFQFPAAAAPSTQAASSPSTLKRSGFEAMASTSSFTSPSALATISAATAAIPLPSFALTGPSSTPTSTSAVSASTGAPPIPNFLQTQQSDMPQLGLKAPSTSSHLLPSHPQTSFPTAPKEPPRLSIAREPKQPPVPGQPSVSTALAPASTTPPDSPPQAIEKPLFTEKDRARLVRDLAHVALLQPHGLMQHFVEFALPGMLKSVIHQHQQELHDAAVASVRRRILARKYGQLWRSKAWRSNLNRRAQTRRQKFAETIRAEHDRKKRGEDELEAILQAAEQKKRIQEEQQQAAQAAERRAFQTKAKEDAVLAQLVGTKRKSFSGQRVNGNNIDLLRQTTKGHKRSRTTGAGASSNPSTPVQSVAPPSTIARSSTSRSHQESIFSGKSMLSRSNASAQKVDTTVTDYFRLKALGIDPETPLVPHTKESLALKQRREEEERRVFIEKTKRRHGSIPVPTSPPPPPAAETQTIPAMTNPKASPTRVAIVEDDFLREMRRAREELAQQTQWFKEQTAELEKEMEREEELRKSLPSSRGSVPASTNGLARAQGYDYLPAEANPTLPLSRTEMRIRTTGAHGLATKPLRASSDYIPVAMSKRSALHYNLGSTDRGEDVQKNGTSQKKRTRADMDTTLAGSESEDNSLRVSHAQKRSRAGASDQHALQNAHSARKLALRDVNQNRFDLLQSVEQGNGEQDHDDGAEEDQVLERDNENDEEGDDDVIVVARGEQHYYYNGEEGDIEDYDEDEGEDEEDEVEQEDEDEYEQEDDDDGDEEEDEDEDEEEEHEFGEGYLRATRTDEYDDAPTPYGGTQTSRASSGPGASVDDALVLSD